ncbi:tyrosine-type recombinase/integrase [Desulfofundulus sp.]|uniref:tyrosine-type recombinase/integrase n=1 Tax=Desulfofundulus sp. TaxID=2282750 RepID=UPI003C70F11E
MKGHIRKRGKNSWAVVVDLPRDPETGKRRRKWVTVQGTKKDAEKVLAKLLTEIYEGRAGTAPARLTLGEYLDRWLETVEMGVKPSSIRTYRKEVGWWKEGLLGNIPLAKLTPLDVQRAVAVLGTRFAPRTVRGAFAILRAALRQAVKWGLLGKDPTDGVKLPPTYASEMKVWTEEDIVRFLRTARKSHYYPLFVLALSTGMRIGELLGLKWEDVDLETGEVYIKRTLIDRSIIKGVVFALPKTRTSSRKVPLDPFTVEILKQHKKKQTEARLKKGPDWTDYGLVFCTNRGLPLYHSNIRAAFKRTVRRAGVPLIRFHDLRHTHATLLLKKSVHPKIVAERLGHSSIKITLDTYSHVLPDTQAEAVSALEKILQASNYTSRRS